MIRQVHYSPWFDADVHYYLAWYAEQGGADLAERLVSALDTSVNKLTSRPDRGHRPFLRDTDLADLRSSLVEPPFRKLVIFYRYSETDLALERLIHGARDLPRRLRESPFERE